MKGPLGKIVGIGLSVVALLAVAGVFVVSGRDSSGSSSPADAATEGGADGIAYQGDLALDRPIANLKCDGSYITMVAAAVRPKSYAQDVERLLGKYPDARYLRTDRSCDAMNPATTSGAAIYQVYFGPFSQALDACAAVGRGPDDAYVKLLRSDQRGKAYLCSCPLDAATLPVLGVSRSGADQSSGAYVTDAQRMLSRAGFDPGPLDGQFGPQTAAATKRFQKKLGLPRSGQFDAATWAAIRSLSCT